MKLMELWQVKVATLELETNFKVLFKLDPLIHNKHLNPLITY